MFYVVVITTEQQHRKTHALHNFMFLMVNRYDTDGIHPTHENVYDNNDVSAKLPTAGIIYQDDSQKFHFPKGFLSSNVGFTDCHLYVKLSTLERSDYFISYLAHSG